MYHIMKGLWLAVKGIMAFLGVVVLISMVVGFYFGVKAVFWRE